MKFLPLLPRAFWTILMCIVAGCAQPARAPSPPPWEQLPPVRDDTIGRLQVDGSNAFINGMRAANGAYVRAGDSVSTGAKTSARVILNPPGGIVQLDENTDPEFTLIKQGACLLIKFAKGQGLLKNVTCVEVAAGGIEIVLKSLVNLKTTERETQVTVLEGHVDVTSPASAAVEQLQQYSFTPAGETRLMQLTAEQANATAAWAQRYFRPPSVQQESGLSPAAAIGAAAAALGLYELFRHGSSSHSQPPPNRESPPTTTTPPPATAPQP